MLWCFAQQHRRELGEARPEHLQGAAGRRARLTGLFLTRSSTGIKQPGWKRHETTIQDNTVDNTQEMQCLMSRLLGFDSVSLCFSVFQRPSRLCDPGLARLAQIKLRLARLGICLSGSLCFCLGISSLNSARHEAHGLEDGLFW